MKLSSIYCMSLWLQVDILKVEKAKMSQWVNIVPTDGQSPSLSGKTFSSESLLLKDYLPSSSPEYFQTNEAWDTTELIQFISEARMEETTLSSDVKIRARVFIPKLREENNIEQVNEEGNNKESQYDGSDEVKENEALHNEYKGILFLAHGVLEHCHHYASFAHSCTKAGYIVFAIDHWGHGLSDGPRGNIVSMEKTIEDLKQLIYIGSNRFPSVKRLYLLGHSMGSIVVTNAVSQLNKETPGLITGFITSGFAGVPGPGSASPFGISALYFVTRMGPFTTGLASVLNFLAPDAPYAPVNIQETSSNTEMIAQQEADELIVHDPITNACARQIGIIGIKKLFDNQSENLKSIVDVPALFLHGQMDKICLPIGSINLLNSIGSKDKTLKFYKEGKHDILFEAQPLQQQVVNDVIQWLNSH